MPPLPDSRPKLLLGEDEANIDEKGRVAFSKKKRERLGEEFVMCLGDNGCIYAYPADVWEPMAADVVAFDRTNQGRQVYTRLVLGTAYDELKFDPQGRAIVPKPLREKAKLKERVVLIGCGDRVEIWAQEELEKHNADPAGYGKERADLIKEARQQMRGDS